jgi:uncharacterized zinc-type alcohol dehydrogenase-like protein
MSAVATKVSAWAAKTPGAAVEPFDFELGELGPHHVEIRVTHCGVCHSDIGIIDDDFKMGTFPVVGGHEVAGIVDRIGSSVTLHKVGDRVGLGWQSGSCGKCEWCLSGQEQLCLQEEDTIVGRHGGFARTVRCQEKFAIPIPEGYASELAGPLMCAGTTVFAPLVHYNVGAGQRTAVVGIGGLGHLALQYMAKRGCEVTALSSSHAKDEEARGFGATAVIATKGGDELEQAAGSFDFILSTASGDLPWDLLIGALRPKGALCIAGVPASAISVNPTGIFFKERRLVGGRAGSVSDTRACVDFAARHGIKPMVEMFGLSQINEALDRSRKGKVHYRAVLDYSR